MEADLDKLKYTEILRLNAELGKALKGKSFVIKVLANISVFPLKELLECTLRTRGIPAQVIFGNFDNIVQDSTDTHDLNALILFWEVGNWVDGLHYRWESMPEPKKTSLQERMTAEIELVLDQIKKVPLVIVNRFSVAAFHNPPLGSGDLGHLCAVLNQTLDREANPNVFTVNPEAIFAQISTANSIDFRLYHLSKTLYTNAFFRAYAAAVKPALSALAGKVKKALIFDCDNTLWKGIVGEDGFDGINMSATNSTGQVFNEVQHLAVDLADQGVIVGVCSKNNPEDVDRVLAEHPDIVLDDKSLAVKVVNWGDKATNVRAIAEILNVGLDSIVFVDDSDFEVALVRELLPEVHTLQVPKDIHTYPTMIREASTLFYRLAGTEEDRHRELFLE